MRLGMGHRSGHSNKTALNASGQPIPTGLGYRKKGKVGPTQEQLCQAIAYGEVEEAIKLLRSGECSINMADCHGNQPLHTALHYDQLHLAEELLKLKCDVNEAEKVTNLCPIHIAAHKTSPECLDLLLQYNTEYTATHGIQEFWKTMDLDERDDHLGNTALGLAAREGHYAIAERLVQAGCNLDVQNYAGETAIRMAVANGHAEIVRLLLQNKASINVAPKGKQESLLSFCLYKHNNDNVLRVLLEYGVDVNTLTRENRTPLMHVINWQQWKMLDLFLDPKLGKNVDVHVKTPDTKESALFFAARKAIRYPKYVKALVRKGALINDHDANGISPLDLAVRNDSYLVAEVLIESGAKIWTRPKFKTSKLSPPLVVCCEEGLLEMAKLLLLHGAPPDATFYNQSSPLMAATRGRHFELVQTLISSGCKVYREKWLSRALKNSDYLEDAPELREKLGKMVKNPALLSGLCRSVVRDYLYENDINLFRILDLSQPTAIKNFLLFQC